MKKISKKQEAIISKISNIIQVSLPNAMSFYLDGEGVKVKFLEECEVDKEENNLKIVTTDYEMKFFDRSGGKNGELKKINIRGRKSGNEYTQ